MKHRASTSQLENLKRGVKFKKGKSGNPNGRPKMIPELKVLLANVLSETKQDMTAAEAILRSLLSRALKGDVRAAEVLLERGWGKVINQVDIKSDGKQLKAPIIYAIGEPPAED